MADSPEPETPISGWKEIATHLGRSVRSVQRYEREFGLPIHRLKASEGGTVYAYRHEIEAWLRDRDSQFDQTADDSIPDVAASAREEPSRAFEAQPPRSRHWGIAVAGILMLILAVYAGSRLGASIVGPAHRIDIVGREIRALDAEGRLVWKYAVDQDVQFMDELNDVGWRNGEIMSVDQDGSGHDRIIVPVRFSAPGNRPVTSDAVYAFASDGTLAWSFVFDHTFTCGSDSFSGPWVLSGLAMSDGPGPRRLWLSFHDTSLWPSIVVEVDAEGHGQLKYLQSGWITMLVHWKTPSGARVVAGGVSNDHNRPMVAVLDEDAPFAVNPTDDQRFSCSGMAARRPSKIFEFQNDELTRVAAQPYAFVRYLRVLNDDLKVTISGVALQHGDGGEIIKIGADMAPKDFYPSDRFWTVHQEYERIGTIDHAAADCPERTQPYEMSSWTGVDGWKANTLQPSHRSGIR